MLRQAILVLCAIIVLLTLVNFLLKVFTRHWQEFDVPEFVGKNFASIDELGAEADLEFVVIDSLYVVGLQPGTVITQSPQPNSKVKSGRKIFLVINSFSPRSEVIPYVAGYSLRGAKNILQGKGFEIEQLIYVPDMATNNVISQSYKGRQIANGSNLKATLGEGITLRVGKKADAPLPIVPNTVGLTLREAKSRIWEVGLNVGNIVKDKGITDMNLAEAKVYKQLPLQQTRLDYGGKVTLYLSIDKNRVEEGVKFTDQQIREAKEKAAEEAENSDVEAEEEVEELQ